MPTPKPSDLAPPSAPKIPHTRVMHGETFVDDYFWLREKDSEPVLSYLRAEEAYANAAMAPRAALQVALFGEIVSHIAEDDETVPARDGAHLYWRKIGKGQSYPVHLRRGLDTQDEQVVLDVNALAAGKEFMGIGELEPSDDGRLLLYSTDEIGFRQYTLRIKNLENGADLPETFPKVVSSTWAADGKTLFYVVEDHAKRPYRLYRHVLGTAPEADVLVYEEADARFELDVRRSSSDAFVLAHSESKLATEVRLIDAREPTSPPRVVVPRADKHEYHVAHRADRLVLRTNDQGRNFRLVLAPLASPADRAAWVELRPHSDAVMIEDVLVLANLTVAVVRESGLPHLEVYDHRAPAKGWRRVAMPDPVYELDLDPLGNKVFASDEVRFVYQSLAIPKRTYSWSAATGALTLLREDPVPGGFDSANYETRRLWATSHDGAQVPISLVSKRGFTGPRPLHIIGYGSYGFPYPLAFSPARLTLLDRGVTIAVAHIRGGGDLGKGWHEDGRLGKKMNTFKDFIACAEHLVSLGATTPRQLSIEGGSAGGLLMGAVTNLRPDLFHAVISQVPFVDVINTMNDPDLPLTVTEYEEWGNPNIAEQYGWMRAYSPYDNLEAKPYPTMLVKTSYHDSQVMYWEPAKYVARLRALKTDDNLLIFKINLGGAGHGGKSGRYDRFREIAYDQAFLLWQHGLAP